MSVVNMTRVRTLRAQVEALEVFRDSMAAAMDGEEFDRLADDMLPMTCRIFRDLEGVERGGAGTPRTRDEVDRAMLWWEGARTLPTRPAV